MKDTRERSNRITYWWSYKQHKNNWSYGRK